MDLLFTQEIPPLQQREVFTEPEKGSLKGESGKKSANRKKGKGIIFKRQQRGRRGTKLNADLHDNGSSI